MKKLLSILSIFLAFVLYGQKQNNTLAEARGLIYKEPEKAIKIAEEIIEKTKKDEAKVAAFAVVINAEMLLGKSHNVIEHCNEAIELAKKKNLFYEQVKLLSMLGNYYQTMMMTKNAKLYLDKAEVMLENKKIPDSLLYIKGNLYNVKGIVFRDELNCEFALQYFDKALVVYKQIKNDRFSITNQALIKIQKDSCLLSQGNLIEAESYFKQVLDTNFDLGYYRYYAEICLAEILIKQKKNRDAEKILSAIPINEISHQDPEFSSLYFSTMSEFHSSEGNTKSFQQDIEKYANAMKNLDANRSVIIDQLIYDSYTKNKESLISLRNKNLIICFFATILGTFIIFYIKRIYNIT